MKIITPKEHFLNLASKWKDEVGIYSTVYHKYINKYYIQIINMGPKVIPYILEDLQNNGSNHWHHALVQLTGENPIIPNNIHGNIQLVCGLWLIWGKQKGIIK